MTSDTPFLARVIPSHAEKQAQIERLERIQADDMADQLHLWEWGRWARRTGNTLGYPRSLLPFAAKGSWEKDLRRYVADLDDETGMLIDAAVAGLPEMHRGVVLAVYKLCIETRRLPHVLQISERQISAYRNQAIGMLWEKLGGRLKTR